MDKSKFNATFETLTGYSPFPWQWDLYANWFAVGKFPDSCNLPTGLGKTSVVAIWLIALSTAPNGKVPRRLVYVVNRRTVVDQTTDEAERLRQKAETVGAPTPAISTLRGQFADNREWSADPSRPAIIIGTVDMIGSRLLFSGYGVGFKAKPLHAGFLGQDALLVHDEAHLEPAFQELLLAIQQEQQRCKEFRPFRVMEMSATPRGSGEVFTLSDDDRGEAEVKKRIGAKKSIHLHENKDEKKLAEEIAELALKHQESGRAILVFVRRVDDVEKVVAKLRKAKQQVQQLTGTLRGHERDQLVEDPIFRRFLPKAELGNNTVYLVCTSAGEVGVNISGVHLVCDLTTFDSMAQRAGRVNRFGNCDETRIDVVYPKSFDEKDDYEVRLKKTLELLRLANGDGSPAALGELHQKVMREGSGAGPMSTDRTQALREYILATYAPQPKTLPVSDILFDAWALTTIRGKLPGRPLVEPYLHGISGWELPETHVAWREDVRVLTGSLLGVYKPQDLLEDYPLKPHELLRDNSSRVFDRLKKLKAAGETPAWLVADDNTVEVTTLGELIEAGKGTLNYKTLVLPPTAGGLDNGMLQSDSETANDVADELRDDRGNRRRVRVWSDDEDFNARINGMRLIRRIDFPAGGEDEDEEGRSWHWFELPNAGDGDGSKANKNPVLWQVHTDDVTNNATACVAGLPLSDEMKTAVNVAARFHDLGKRRMLFQRILGNTNPHKLLAKSGRKGGRVAETYRHEFGSLLDVQNEPDFQKLSVEMQDLVLHLIAVHHGRGRPHFPPDEAFDPEPKGLNVDEIVATVPRRFAKLQRTYGRWGLAYLESLLRAADYAASANPSRTEGEP